MTMVDRSVAVARDAADPLAAFVDRFATSDDPRLLYFDGNSLGPQPDGADAAVAAELQRWGRRLIRGWNERWLDLVDDAAARIAGLIGAPAGSVVVTDSTTVCLFKLSHAALERSGRPDVVSDRGNFPTDLYVLEGAARVAGGRLRLLDPGPEPETVAAALDDEVGLVALSHVDFRTGALLDLPAITACAHAAGALALWDLSHAAGVVVVDVAAHDVDLAVGCTYKYLHGGPGAPAYLYIRPDLADELRTPIPGWFGHAAPFAMEAAYRPAAGVDRFRAGTPPMLSVAGMIAGLDLVAAAGVDAIRDKSTALTSQVIDLADAWLSDLGVAVATPRDPGRRGSQVALRHPRARKVTAMLADAGVIVDFREPDIVRIGLSPLGLRHVDVHDGLRRLADGLARGDVDRYPDDLGRVT